MLPQFFYALLYNNFSGVTLYESYLYQLVNVVYTSLPIVIYAIYDFEMDDEVLMKDPQHYMIGLRRIFFNQHIFIVW